MLPETKGRDADVIDYEEWQEASGQKLAKEKVVSEKVASEKDKKKE